MTNHPYRLHAAFFHRGGAAGGHYWVYIYDHKKEVWRKYNDDRVSVVDNLNEIFGAPDPGNVWASPNPYFLVYVKELEIEKIVETVKRDVVFPAPDGPPPQLPARDSNSMGMSQMDHMPPTAHAANGYNQGQDGTYDVEMTNCSQEQREFQQIKQSKPQAYKSQYLSEIKGVEYGAPTGINKQGNWDDSNADVGRLRQW
jgi:Ubiquitin carboxyl-terminal hydrolase